MVTAPPDRPDMVRLPGGSVRLGSDRFYPEEAPSRIAEIAPFAIARAPVTNRQFAAFVATTGHVTEAEWEYAARGGLDDADYAWGDVFMPDGRRMANTWHGPFPIGTDRGRAVRTTAVGRYPPNGFGLHDMIGNVWEWTADRFDASAGACCGEPTSGENAMVVKGGSFLCSPDYCARYRPAARQPQTRDTATVHIGLRCPAD